jgi:hypothetical protein
MALMIGLWRIGSKSQKCRDLAILPPEKIVAAVSPQLFARQPVSYQRSVASPADRLDAR